MSGGMGRNRRRSPAIGALITVLLAACGSVGPHPSASSTAARPTPQPTPMATPLAPPTTSIGDPYPTPAPPPSASISNLRMFSPTDGWAQEASDRAVLHTTQGVQAWTVGSPDLPAGQAIVALSYVDAGAARLLAAGGLSTDADAAPVTMTFISWATDDGGARWTEGGSFSAVQDPGLSWQGDLDYVNGLDGWFSANQDDTDAGLGTTLFRTVDGGAGWAEVTRIASAPAGAETCFAQPTATFDSPMTGWLTGGGCSSAEFEVSSDGGATWGPQTLPLSGTPALSLGAPVFISGQVGVMPAFSAGGGGPVLVYLTADGGETWTASTAPGEIPHAVDFIDAENGWLLSTDTMDAGYPAGLYATHDGGQTWTTLQAIDDGRPNQGTFALNGTVLDFITPTLGWTDTFSGSGDTLLQTTDGGLTWAPVTVQVSPAGA